MINVYLVLEQIITVKRRKKKQKMVRAREKKKEDKYDGKEREEIKKMI